MEKIICSAPTKIILCGEHFVVYGATAITFQTSLVNDVHLEVLDEKGASANEKKNAGQKGRWTFEIISNDRFARMAMDGKMDGDATLCHFLKIYKLMLGGPVKGKRLRATFVNHGAFKGMGNSASFATALARCVLKYAGRGMGDDELFSVVQEVEAEVHGGKGSGVDPRTVIAKKPQLFSRSFNPTKFDFKDIELKLPKDAVLIAIDTCKNVDSKRSTTAEMIAKFAQAHGIVKKPDELADGERAKLIGEYMRVYGKIKAELHAGGNAQRLGVLMNENQKLLASVSSSGIDEALKIAAGAGALGGKLTGAGGEGGAALVLAMKKDADRVIEALAEKDYHAFVVL